MIRKRGWGRFTVGKVVHVAPVDEFDFVAPSHRLSLDCQCKPKVIEETATHYALVEHHSPRQVRTLQ